MSGKRQRGRNAQDLDALVEQAIQEGLSIDPSQYDPHPVRRNLGHRSKEQYDRELRLWEAFKRKFPESNPQDIQTLKQYAEFLGRSKEGRLPQQGDVKRPTARSVRVAMRRFCNAWERENHKYISHDVSRSMAPYIEGELAQKLGLLTGKAGQKRKAFLTIENYVHMQTRLWTNDFHDYTHEGTRIDNSNLLNTHCFTSARCQEVCQAKYQDLECIVSWRDGLPEFRCKFTREVCKATDVNQPEHPFAEHMLGPDGLPPPLFAQPMLHWLANIISAKAFANIHTVEQALAVQPPRNGNYRIINWADDARDKPIFPEWSFAGPKEKSKNPKSWVSQFSNLAKRAGFTASQGLHSARREALIKVNDNGYSLGQVLRFASQNNTHVLVNHYLGNISSIDGAGSFLGMNLRSDLAEDFRSATMRRNPDLRFSLPSEAVEELHNTDGYKIYTEKINKITLEKDSSESPEHRAKLEMDRKVLYDERRLLVKSKLQEFQASQEIIYDADHDDIEEPGWHQSFFQRIRSVLPEERVRLAQTLQLRAHPRSPEWILALKDLVSLRTSDSSVAYQKELAPVEGCCPSLSCKVQMKDLPRKDRWRHIYRCLESLYAQRSGFARFCFLCSTWQKGKAAWAAHCEEHVEKLDVPIRCNPITFRHAIASAGYCPVHLGKIDLSAEERMGQWTDHDAWKRHISKCLATYVQARHDAKLFPCPHPKCCREYHAEKDLWHHLGDIHGVDRPVSVSKRKACSADIGDMVEPPPRRTERGTPISQPKEIIIPQLNNVESFHVASEGCQKAASPKSEVRLSLEQDEPRNGRCQSSSSTPLLPAADSLRRFGDSDEIHPIETTVSLSQVAQNNATINGLSHWSLSTEVNAVPIDPLLMSINEGSLDGTPDDVFSSNDEYQVDRLVGRWGRNMFYLRWQDGSYGWEPREHILDEELVTRFEKDYQGFDDGVEVLRTRVKSGKVEYRLHWTGRPTSEDWWVAEKYLSPELIEKHKPRRMNQKRRKIS